MRVTYFGYYFTHQSDPTLRLRANLSPLLRNFDRFATVEQRLSVKFGDELLVSALLASPYILLVQTRRGEIVKRVQSGGQISVDDLSSMLTATDQLGFGSYLGVHAHHIALGTKHLSPRSQQVSQYVQKVLDLLDIPLTLQLVPLLDEFPRDKVASLHSVGSVHMKLDVTHKLFRSWVAQLSGGADRGTYDIGSFKVTITPDGTQSKSKVKDGPKQMLQDLVALGDEGLVDLEVRARIDANEAVRDLYLASKGQLADSIGSVKEAGISVAMSARQAANKRLQSVLGEFHGTLVDKADLVERLEHYSRESSWSRGDGDDMDVVPTGSDPTGSGG